MEGIALVWGRVCVCLARHEVGKSCFVVCHPRSERVCVPSARDLGLGQFLALLGLDTSVVLLLSVVLVPGVNPDPTKREGWYLC